MRIILKPYSSLTKNSQTVALLVASSAKNFMKLPAGLRGVLKIFQKKKIFRNKLGEVICIPQVRGALDMVCLAGLGQIKELSVKRLAEIIRTIIRRVQKNKITSLTIYIPEKLTSQIGAVKTGELVAEAVITGAYNNNKYKTKAKPKTKLTKVIVVLEDKHAFTEFRQGLASGQILGESINLVREYGNLPANEMTPTLLAEWAKNIAKITKQKLTILSEREMKRLKMGGILGVSNGSAQEAKFIVLEHMMGNKKERPIVLIGKGITFDSGGISIKPSQAMDEMKFDMSGGGAILGVMRCVGLYKLPINVIGLVPASENVLSGTAYKPGDILTLGDGTTVEVLNTDAEGRIILADALIYARKYKPQTIIDVATLTGAIVAALGDCASGLFANQTDLENDLVTAATEGGETMWPMPLPKEYAKRMKSGIADLRNISSKSGGGAITAAKFLEYFIMKGTAWSHLDIAGTAWTTSESASEALGATGVSVKTILNYLRKQVDK